MITKMLAELRSALSTDVAQIRYLLKKSPGAGYARITEIGRGVGSKYGVKLVLNFPARGRIEESEMYGRRDLSIIIDMEKKTFPIERHIIGEKALEYMPGARIEDAYMYEGKEGLKVFHDGGRIDILPHSLHVWCEFTGEVTSYCEWLWENVYGR